MTNLNFKMKVKLIILTHTKKGDLKEYHLICLLLKRQQGEDLLKGNMDRSVRQPELQLDVSCVNLNT